MDAQQIILVFSGIFWGALIGAFFYRFKVPLGERREYDVFVKRFSYITAMITIGSVLFWLDDSTWRNFLDYCREEEHTIFIKALFLSLFWFFGLAYLLILWRRRTT